MEEQHFDKYGNVNQTIKKENGTVIEKFVIIYSDNELDSNVITLEHADIQLSANSKLRKIVDKDDNVVYNCEYDELGNLCKVTDKDNVVNSSGCDELGRLILQSTVTDDVITITRSFKYKDDSNNIIEQECCVVEVDGEEEGEIQTDYVKDGLNRPTSTTVTDSANNGYKVTYGYYPKEYQERVTLPPIISPDGTIIPGGFQIVTTPDGTTGYTQTVKSTDIASNVEGAYKKETITYDANGNITNIEAKLYNADEVLQSTSVNSYVYDNLNRLIRENNADLQKSFTYEYDIHGNLTAKNEYAYTTGTLGTATATITPIYNNKNRLTGNDGVVYLYDNHGNVLNTRYKTLDWDGNKLSKVTAANNSNTYVKYNYDHNGKKISCEYVNDSVLERRTHYAYSGDKLVYEISYTGNNLKNVDYIKGYVYNESGLVGFSYNDNVYTVRKNLFGDVTELYQGATRVAKYKYDAWGNCTVCNPNGTVNYANTFIGNLNPFRYRGYYYDTESRLFTVGSRYYLSELGRFIQPENVLALNTSAINGLNLYSYANNNPINIVYNAFGGMVSSIGASISFTGNRDSSSISKGGLNLGWIVNKFDAGSTFHGLYSSASTIYNNISYFSKNLHAFSEDMTMLGASMKDGVLAFNQFSWGLGKSDVVGIALGVGLDIYDSIQRGVSPGGVALGATLTAAKGVGLIYLNKGILYGATALGSAICPGVGTIVGFVVGSVVCVLIDTFVGGWLDDLIDSIAK